MPTKIDLPKQIVRDSFTQRLQSLARASKAATNPLIKTALDDEAAQITAALTTMTEINK